jgi:hypothetical protein
VSDPTVDGLEVTWGRAAKVWWSLAWRTVVVGFLAGGLLGAVLGVVLAVAGKSPQEIAAVTTWAGFAVGLPVAIWAVRSVLKSSWSDFRIALVCVPHRQ